MKKKISIKNIIVFSRSKEFILICDKLFKNKVVCFDKLGALDKKILKKKKIKIFPVKNNLEIMRVINKNNNNQLALSYGFGIIFKKKIINNFEKGIWNLHASILPNYRGRHPIAHAILNDEEFIGATIHKIDEKIDLGYIISQGKVKRKLRDDENLIKEKILNLFEKKLIFEAIDNFDQKKIKKIKNKGKYYPPIKNGLTIKKTSNHKAKYIFNAIYSQRSFNGLKILDKRYFDAYYVSKKNINKYLKKDFDIIKSRDNVFLAIK